MLDRFLRLVSGFENGGKYARSASKLTAQSATDAAKKRMDAFHDCVRVNMAVFNFLNADATFNQESMDNPLMSWVLTKWEDAMPSVAGVAGASPRYVTLCLMCLYMCFVLTPCFRWANHVGTYAKVFSTMSTVTALQLGLVIPPTGVLELVEEQLAAGDFTSAQYRAVQDLKELQGLEHNDFMDVLGTYGGKLVTEVINFPLLDAIFYGFATLVISHFAFAQDNASTYTSSPTRSTVPLQEGTRNLSKASKLLFTTVTLKVTTSRPHTELTPLLEMLSPY